MKKNNIPEQDYVNELVQLIRTTKDESQLPELLSDYHEKDLAEAITLLTPQERRHLYPILGAQTVAEIFSYLDDAEPYMAELSTASAAKVVSQMDADDAVDLLDDLPEDKQRELVDKLDRQT